MSATLTVRMKDEEKQLISDFSRVLGLTSSEYVRKTVLEAIDDAIDSKVASDAIDEFDANPVFLTHSEMMAELGLE